MEPLSTGAQARLAAFRRAESPPRGAADRCLVAIEQRLEGGDLDDRAPPRRTLLAPLITGLALAAGVLLALTWAVTHGQGGTNSGVAAPYHNDGAREQHVALPRGAGQATGAPRKLVPAAPREAIPADSIAEPDQPVPSDSPREPVPTDSPGEPVPSDSSPPLGPELAPFGPELAPDTAKPTRRPADDVAAEVDLLRRAKLAAPAARLALLDEHARRFPSGTLAAERDLLVIETRCALNEVERARHLAARFIRRFPGSPLAEKAATICGGP